MFNLIRMWIKREIVREIAVPSDGSSLAEDSRTAVWEQLADEIRAQGSGADVAANCLRAYMLNPFPPSRPKHPPKAIEHNEEKPC